MSEDSLDELRAQTQRGDRIQDEADQGDFGSRVQAQLDAIEAGDKSHTVSAYDQRLAAVLHALDASNGALEECVGELQERLGRRRDASDANRSELVKYALRFALQEVDEERYDAAKGAYGEWSQDEF